jgi:hypothetical protein
MPSFEAMLVKCWNEFYDKEKIAAMAYRLPMVRYRQQGFDVYSDSRHYSYYAAFECKSVEAEKEEPLYFSRYFHHVKGVHQLEYENGIAERSGRATFLAVELKRRRGCRKSAFLVPWRVVMHHYSKGDVGIEALEITTCVELDYSKGGYHVTDDVKEAYLHQVCGKPKSKKNDKVEVRDWHSRSIAKPGGLL